MDRPADLLEEYDLTPEELRTKRRAEFDRWFDQPSVRLYEAVMLSVLIIPHPEYRLKTPLPVSHPPRYPDEFFFGLMRHPQQFHERMVLAIVALRADLLKGKAEPASANESEYAVTLAEFERWANKEGISLPDEWRRQIVEPNRAPPQQIREQSNLLRIVRALIRAARVSDEATLCDVVARARLFSPVEPEVVERVFHAVSWEDQNPSSRSREQKKSLQNMSNNADLISIIAALICLEKLQIDRRPRKGGAKRVDRLVNDDLRARAKPGAPVPKIDTIETVFKRARAALSDTNDINPI